MWQHNSWMEIKIDGIAEHVRRCNQLLKEVSLSELASCTSFEDINGWMQRTGRGLMEVIAVTRYPLRG